jgi:hypothetical protein
MDKAMIPAKLNSAQRKLDNNNVRGALTEFREVLSIELYGIEEYLRVLLPFKEVQDCFGLL